MPSARKDGAKKTWVAILAAAWLAAGCAGTGDSLRNPGGPGASTNDDPLWFVDAMVSFVVHKTELIVDHLPDCGKAFDATLEFIQEQSDTLIRVATAMHEVEDKGPDRLKLEAAHQIMKRMGPHFQETMEVQRKFSRQCPLEHQRIKMVMSDIHRRAREPTPARDAQAGDEALKAFNQRQRFRPPHRR